MTGREVRYAYDWSSPGLSSSNNNRLLSSQEVLTAAPNTIYSTTWYTYNCAGNVERVVTQSTGSAPYSSTRFSYAKNQRSVSFALAETWEPDGNSDGQVDNYAVQWLREFRYDSGRARYLNRKLDPVTLAPIAADTVWTDYDGNEPYGDFAIVQSGSWFASNTRSYQPGVATIDPWTSIGGANTKYYHTDHLGTTRTMSTSSDFDGGARVFTAFGERIAGPTPPDRYGYVGAHGYQTHDDLPFQHVGARYYDPGSGRFLQRDPIGIAGGINLYEYSDSAPTMAIDPDGLTPSMSPPAMAGAGFTAEEIAGILGVTCAIGGTFGYAEWKKHRDAVDRWKEEREFLDKLKDKTKGPKKKRPIEKVLKDLKEKIKNHEKEMKQKWPNGPPAG